MIWHHTETAHHPCPIRVVGPHTAWECLNNTSGEAMVARVRRIDANHTPRCNIWLTPAAFAQLVLDDISRIWDWGAAQTLNGTLLKRLLSVRTEWSKK